MAATNEPSRPVDAAYDGTDNAEFRVSPAAKTSSQMESVERPSALRMDTDYHAGAPPLPSQKKKGKAKSKGKKKRVRSRIADDPAPVSRGHARRLRESNNEDSDEGSDDDNDAHYANMVRAARRQRQHTGAASAHRILRAIEAANAQGDGDGDGDGDRDEAVDRGSQILYDEMQAFLERVPATAERQPGGEQPEPKPLSPSSTRVVEVNEKADSMTDDVTMKDSTTTTATVITPAAIVATVPTVSPTTAHNGKDQSGNPKDEEPEKPRLSGVAATLQRLRENGALGGQRRPQVGRGKGRMLAETADGEDDSVRLAYVDEQGNDLTPKEAFRMLCHRFHGNAPGKNKSEKRLKKMLDDMRVRSMSRSDTPLAAAAALRRETRRAGAAHVVLSGAQAFQGSAQPEDEKEKAMDKQKEKELKPADDDDNDKKDGSNDSEERVHFSIDGMAGNPAAKRRRR